MGNSQIPDTSDVVDPLWRRVLNDRFTILEPIGSGGMGKVYKAVQAPLDRVVALKVLNPSYANGKDPEFRKRFFLEASLTSRLRHPNTITVIDYGQTPDGIFYIAMEYLEGHTLAQLLAKSGPLRWTRCLNICQQICRSLREAHKLGVIHRDLKPANVMLISEDQETDLVKVLDFGLVKSFVSEPDKSRPAPSPVADTANGSINPEVTHGGVFLGSPQYMAPEQARNRADQRSDIYSLGTTCYHMLAGRPPFWANDAVEVIFKHINEPVPPLRSVRADCDAPPEFEAVLMKCLEKQPANRFQSMDEVLEALRRVALAAGNSGVFITGVVAPNGVGNTPPPIAISSIPPPTPLPPPIAKLETTLALDISVDPSTAVSPPAIWYQNRKYLYAGAGALLLLVALVFALARPGSSRRKPTPDVETVTKAAPVQPPALVDRATERPAPPPAPKVVKFRVSTEPLGATVSIDGRVAGTTPVEFEVLGNNEGVATAQLVLTMKGYHPMTVTTGGSGEVVLNQKLQIRIPGRPLPPPVILEPKERPIESPAITVAVPEPKKPELEAKVALAKPVPTFEQPKAPAPAMEEAPPPVPVASVASRPEPPAPEAAPAPTGPVEFTDAMMPPIKMSGPDPEYTQKAIDHEAEGTMMVRCVVTIQGLVHSCRALKTVPFMERPVIEALERRRYKPASLHGKAIEIYYTFRITLKLPHPN